MKKLHLLLAAAVALFLVSCMSTMPLQPVQPTKGQLTNAHWELEYITGPRIAFEGLYPDKKPEITFNAMTNTVSGNNSCNGYSADYKVAGNMISFGDPGISTMMYCGEGEKIFLSTMKKVNRY